MTLALATVAAASLLTGCSGGSNDSGSNNDEIAVVSREDGSGTRGAFVELFGIEEEQDGKKRGYDNTVRSDYKTLHLL